MMANMLTYYSSKSAEYSRKANGLIQFPDENFAREVMQLFTVGSVHLNNDGTTLLDNKEHGNAVYSNEDVTEYARIWTGLGKPKTFNLLVCDFIPSLTRQC